MSLQVDVSGLTTSHQLRAVPNAAQGGAKFLAREGVQGEIVAGTVPGR